MKKRYEAPETEEFTVVSENVMQDSAEETEPETDNEYQVSNLVKSLFS